MRSPRDIARDRQIFEVLRLVRGLNHSEVARKAGISQSTVSKLRRSTKDGGTRFPHSVTLQAIAKAAGYKMTWEPIAPPHRASRHERQEARLQ